MRLTIWQWLGIVMVATMVVLVLWLWIDNGRIAGYKLAAQGYQDAQATNLATIATLSSDLKATQAQWQADTTAAHKAADLAARMAAAAADELAHRKSTRTVIYEKSPSAAAWRDAVVPDAIADSVRN